MADEAPEFEFAGRLPPAPGFEDVDDDRRLKLLTWSR